MSIEEAASVRMTEIWRASIPGHTTHTVLADPGSKSLFVSDGWGVAYPTLRLHRLHPETGEAVGEIRTRQQHVSALAVMDDSLYVATHSRLLQVRPGDLHVLRHWDRVLPSDSQQLVAAGDWLVAANWRKPVLGLFHPQRQESVRLRVGLQPLLATLGNTVRLVEGYAGGVRSVDLDNASLLGAEPGPPVSAVATGTELWGILGGPPAGTGAHGTGSAWSRPGTDRLTRMADPTWTAILPAPASAIYCDDQRGLLWCRAGPNSTLLVAVSQEDSRVVASFPAGDGRYWLHVDPGAGLAVEATPVQEGIGYRASRVRSTLVAHLLIGE